MASKTTLRTHNCGELNLKNDGNKVKLCGWDHARRDHGGIIFIDLRDRYGLTQIVFDPKHKKEAHLASEDLSREDVIQIEGTVRERPKGMENKKMPTGEIEVLVDKIHVLAKADTPPLEVDDRVIASEEMRLKFRYLDLRRPIMQKRLMFRHRLAQAAREYLSNNDFMEIETPILVRSTPEGARDYIVPSRVHPGKFYALPQSPQLYKQISMVAGCDRYFQLARCLRDEDLRADRQPEHTQIDMEMSFVDMDDVLTMVEGLIKHLFKKTLDMDIKTPFVRIPHREAMEKYGVDKPDLRFGLELCDVTEIVKKSEFQVFKNAQMTKCLACEDKFSRKDIEDLTAMAQAEGAKGLAWIRLTDKGPEGTIAKFVDKKIIDEIVARSKAKTGGILFFIADKKNVCNSVLSKIRLRVGDLQGLRKDEFKFCWVTEFPMFSWNEEEEKWEPEHHIFTHPRDEDLQYLDTDPSKVLGKLYDLVLNGTELSSGSIRINRREMQQKVFATIGLKPEDAEVKFGFLLKAFKYGAPPHGGVGIGLDRLCALMQGLTDIREVIAYPKNKSAECPMDGSPNVVDERQMKDLHLKCEVTVKARDVVFDQIKEYFDNNKVNYSVIEHKAVFKADEAAKARGVELKQVAKAMVCKSENKYIMALIPGDKELDMDKLRMTAGVKNLVLASSDEVRDITGCSVAAVPPFGNFFSLDMYIDKQLMEEKTIAFNAGSQTKSIKMFLGDFKNVMKMIQGDFAK